MDNNIFYSTIKTKRLPENVVDKTIADFTSDHRVSAQARSSRIDLITWEKEKQVLGTIVSRTAFFASVLIGDASAHQKHDLHDLYHAMGLHILTGQHAELARFTFCTFVDQKLSNNFTITPEVRMLIATVSRGLEKQSSIILTRDEIYSALTEFCED